MPITQGELAEEFKVSQMTVSRALRGTLGVGTKLRAAILKRAQEGGYSAESSFEARSLRSLAFGTRRETKVICVIVRDMASVTGTNSTFNHLILMGILDSAKSADTEIIVAPHVESELPRVVLRRQVDGVIWLLSDINILKGAHCPVPWVSLLFDVPGADVVAIDNTSAAQAIGRHLAGLGHRQVAFIGPDSPLARERLEGLRAGLRESDGQVPDTAVCLERFAMSPPTTERLMTRLWEQSGAAPGARPWTAVAVYNDFMAITAMRFLHAKGLRIPQDVSVTGFDGICPEGMQPPVPIATAVIPLADLGGEAVQLLDWRLKHPGAPRRRILLDARFEARATTGPAVPP